VENPSASEVALDGIVAVVGFLVVDGVHISFSLGKQSVHFTKSQPTSLILIYIGALLK